jgi:hypothetical protein
VDEEEEEDVVVTMILWFGHLSNSHIYFAMVPKKKE